MEVPQKVAVDPVTGVHGDGVKTKTGVKTCFRALGGGSQFCFLENSSDLGHYFLPSRPEKSQITGQLEAHDLGYNV